MSRTSKALKRLGVAGVGAATVASGLIALAPVAHADPATGINIIGADGNGQNIGAAGTCNLFTVYAFHNDVSHPSGGQTVLVSATPSKTDSAVAAKDVHFCAASAVTTGDLASPAVAPSDEWVNADGGHTALFTTDSHGNVTFGVVSYIPNGNATLRAFVDSNGNGSYDAGEPASAPRSSFWTAGGAPGSNDAADAVAAMTMVPNDEYSYPYEQRTFTVQLFNDATNQDFTQPDTTTVAGVTPNISVDAGHPIAGTCTASNNKGISTCTVAMPSQDGDYVVTAWVNQTGSSTMTPGLDAGEPFVQSGETVLPAPSSSWTVSTVCGSMDASSNLDSKPAGANGEDCLVPAFQANGADKPVTFTATVNDKYGHPVTDHNVLIAFWFSGSGANSLLSPYECDTLAAGSCSVTVDIPAADRLPGAKLVGSANIRTTSIGSTSVATFLNQPGDARWITFMPATQGAQPGSLATVSALVTDATGSAVKGVTVVFDESGPGRFVDASSEHSAVTDASGKAYAELTALPGESGAESINAYIDSPIPSDTYCQQLAGHGYLPSGAPVDSDTAAGNCSSDGTVNWGVPPTISYSQPDKTAGQTVTFSGSAPANSTVNIEIKNATTAGAYKPLATVTADNTGSWSYATPMSYNSSVLVWNAAGSNAVFVHVNVKVTIDAIQFVKKDARGMDVTQFRGGVYPYIPGARVWIRNAAVSPSAPIGSSSVVKYGASGRYVVYFGLKPGQSYKLFSLISGTGSDGVQYTDNGTGAARSYTAPK